MVDHVALDLRTRTTYQDAHVAVRHIKKVCVFEPRTRCELTVTIGSILVTARRTDNSVAVRIEINIFISIFILWTWSSLFAREVELTWAFSASNPLCRKSRFIESTLALVINKRLPFVYVNVYCESRFIINRTEYVDNLSLPHATFSG